MSKRICEHLTYKLRHDSLRDLWFNLWVAVYSGNIDLSNFTRRASMPVNVAVTVNG